MANHENNVTPETAFQTDSFQQLLSIESNYIQTSFDKQLSNAVNGTIENNIWHKNDNVYTHTQAVYSELIEALNFTFINTPSRKVLLEKYLSNNIVSDISFATSLLAATFFHDIGKKETIVTDKTGATSCPEHEAKGGIIATEIFGKSKSFSMPEFVTRTKEIITNHTVPHGVFTPNESLQERLTNFLQDYSDIAIELALLGYADTRGCQLEQLNQEEFNARMEAYHNFFNSASLDQYLI